MTNQLMPNFNQRLQNGLVPAIVTDFTTGAVLMLAYMNAESFQRTCATKETWFWSRERNELWHKGATSGHTQHVETMMLDCDADTLLIQVTPNGPACHTGATTCFFNPVSTKEDLAE